MPKHQHIEVRARESIGSEPGGPLRWLATLLFAVGLWALIGVLEIAATRQWLGPVLERNLERGLDAGALFYTEVDVAPDAGRSAGGRHR